MPARKGGSKFNPISSKKGSLSPNIYVYEVLNATLWESNMVLSLKASHISENP